MYQSSAFYRRMQEKDAYFLKKADQSYLSGDFASAKNIICNMSMH